MRPPTRPLAWRPRFLVVALLSLASFTPVSGRRVFASRAGTAPAPVAAPTHRVVIDAGGQRAMEITQQGDSLRIATTKDEPALVGELHGAGKRKYRPEGAGGAP